MLCPNCGRNVNRGDRVCGHCGTRLPYEKMSDLEAAPPLSFLKGEQRGSGTEALQNAVNSQAQRIRELASEVEFLRAREAKSRGKTKRAFCMSIVSLVLCLLFVVISFVYEAYMNYIYVEGNTNKLFNEVSALSEGLENEMSEREKIDSRLIEIKKELDALKEQSEQVWLRFEENLPDGAAGTVEIPSRLCKIDVPATIPPDEPTHDGYVFSGWNTKPNGSGDKYDPGQDITLKEDLTLYAQWGLPKPTPKPALEPTLEPTPEPEPTQVPTQEPEPTPPTMPPTTP